MAWIWGFFAGFVKSAPLKCISWCPVAEPSIGVIIIYAVDVCFNWVVLLLTVHSVGQLMTI
jgi:hypothetical protein